MKLGIRAHDMGMKNNPRQVAAAAGELGFEAVQLVLHKAIANARHLPGELDEEFCREVKDAFAAEGLEIALLGAYFNWFHDSDGKDKAKYIDHLQKAALIGTSIVGTEVQGVRQDRWGIIPENDSPEAWEKVVATAGELASAAEKANVYAGIEGAVSHVLSTPQKVRNLVDETGSDNFALIFDLFNFLNQHNHTDQHRIIDQALDLYGNQLKIIHCKDFIPKPDSLEQTALGRGHFDYSYLLKRLEKLNMDNVTLIFEGITGSDITESLTFLKGILPV